MSMHEENDRRRRWWVVLQLSGVGLLLGALLALGLVVGAGATGPSTGTVVSGVLQPEAGFAAGIPFASGQEINVVVPVNETFSSDDGLNNNTEKINLLECSAPEGVVPTNPSACDGNTIQGNTILPNADGSFTYDDFPVYALPNAVSLGESPGGVACGDTAATECILYIGNNQADFTQPHLWSSPFYVAPNSTDSGTPAGDGSAPAAATAPDPGLSTVVAAPGTATADGTDISTVSVTLLGTGSLPVAGKAVSLTATSCSPSPCAAVVSTPSPTTSNASGQVAFTVTDTVAQSVTLTAEDTTDSVTLDSTPTVTYQAPVVDASHSSVSANPTTAASGGSTSITVTLRDQGTTAPQPVAGKTVTLSGDTGNSAVITPAATPNVTNAAGQATFTVTDPAAETVTFTATDATDSTVVTNTVSVTFGTLTVSSSKSTVTVSSPNPAPLGGTGTEAVVTLLSSTGSPVAGKGVSLAASAGTSVTITPLSSPATTNAQGQVLFSLIDTVPESSTLTATDTTDSFQLTSQPTVTFASPSPSATTSTVSAQATTAPADGSTQVGIFVTLNDQFGNPVSGKTITVSGSPTGNVLTHPFAIGSAMPGVTNSSGQVQFEADDTDAQMITFTATDSTDGIVLSQTVSVTFTPLPADPAGQDTTVKASPSQVAADGTTPSTITVTLTDYFGNPIEGKSIALKALNGSSSISPSSPVATSATGQATFTTTDSTAEVVTYQATDVTDDDAVLQSEAVVTFGNPPSPPAVASFCSVVANPNSVPADGTHTATISVLLYDGNGDPVSGKTVSLSASGGSSKVAATNATSNTSGIATFTVSDTTAEAVTYTADDTSDSINLTAIPVKVTFTAAAGSTSTASTTTTTTTASSTTSTTVGSTTSTSTALPVSSAGITGNTGAGSTSSSGSTGSTLAETGASALLPWLVGFGVLLLAIGTLGRRRFNVERRPGGESK